MADGPVPVSAHLRRMRRLTVAFLVSVPVAAAVSWLVEPRPSAASPTVVTAVCVAAALWIGFTAERDAGRRLEQARRAYAVQGDLELLLRHHLLAYAAVLLRLELIVVCGVVVAIWGAGGAFGLSLLALAALMMALTWPTADKTDLLVRRARAERDERG